MIKSGSAITTPSCAEISVGLPHPIWTIGPKTVVAGCVGRPDLSHICRQRG